MRNFRINRIIRRSSRLLKLLQWTLIRNSQKSHSSGNRFYSDQRKALEAFEAAVSIAHAKLILTLRK